MKKLSVVIEKRGDLLYIAMGNRHVYRAETYEEVFRVAVAMRETMEHFHPGSMESAVLTHETAKEEASAWAKDDGMSQICVIMVGDEIFPKEKNSYFKGRTKPDAWVEL